MIFFKRNKQLLSVCDGKCAALEQIPDEAFSSGILGQGVALFPTSGAIFSPVNGRVESIAEGKHAYTILSDDGLELLIHIGVDTVELKGEPFTPLVKEGDSICVGEPISKVNLKRITDRGLSTATALLITNHEKIEITDQRYGDVIGGKTPVLTYRIVQKG